MTDRLLVNPSFDPAKTTKPASDLLAEQRRLDLVIGDMEQVVRNAHQYDAEGRFYAGVAALWAGALLSADVARCGMTLLGRVDKG